MVGINQVTASIIAGCAVSCGAVLVVAGAGKLYRGVRGLDDSAAIRRALRMPQRQWRLTGLAAGGVECATGALVCSGAYPVLGGVGLAALGAVFCVLLGYVLIKRIPGGCGCIWWSAASKTATETVTWRSVARGGMLFGAGIADVTVPADTAKASYRGWFDLGIAAGGILLVLLSVGMPGSAVCRRPLWRRTHATLRALAGHETFAAMAASAGPFGPVARYHRTGCTDEFWFTAVAPPGSQVVVFRVNHAAPGARLAVHASLRDGQPPGTAWPTRTITTGNGGRRHEVPEGL